MIQSEREQAGISSRLSLQEQATISIAVFEGLSMFNVVEPALVTSETVDAALTFLMAAEYGLAVDTGTAGPPRDSEADDETGAGQRPLKRGARP